MNEQKNPTFVQGSVNLCAAANMADVGDGPMPAPQAKPPVTRLSEVVATIQATAARKPPPHTCQQRLKLSFYFDGTGNNRIADQPTWEHSNVARLYNARRNDVPEEGIYSFYVEGLGTYFGDIGDPGEADPMGKGFGKRGEARLQWALGKLQERRASATKLIAIDIAVFGFSRGAALARAFANRVQKLCEPEGAHWVLKGTAIGVDIYFMGLWDTVASVGALKSLNNQTKVSLAVSGVAATFDRRIPPSQRMRERDLRFIAYGAPGADPAAAFGILGKFDDPDSQHTVLMWADGHMDWGAEMAIPPIVSKGVHMMAGHEIRNSFPADSVRTGRAIPNAFLGTEWVYPGVHSDVGGGYRPGEGGRALLQGQQLSLISLRAMYSEARSAGVPQRDLFDPAINRQIRLDFAMAIASDPEENHAAAREYAQLHARFTSYMNYCGRGPHSLGGWFLAHMKAYYAWRFWNIKKNRVSRATNQPTVDEAAVKPLEQRSIDEDKALAAQIEREENSVEVQQARTSTQRARVKDHQARQRLMLAQQSPARWPTPMTAEKGKQFLQERANREMQLKADVAQSERELADAEQAQLLAEDPMRRLQARKATLPSQGKLGRNWREYDERLYADAELLYKDTRRHKQLRPHYKALMQAWVDEFKSNAGLIDQRVIDFFEMHVHDSLADFAMDATLPSDPRVIYVGGDEIELYARGEWPMPATPKAA